jgi:hypothetical protein
VAADVAMTEIIGQYQHNVWGTGRLFGDHEIGRMKSCDSGKTSSNDAGKS